MLPWKPEFWSDLAQNLMQSIRHPMMLQMKFDHDRPTGLRDIHGWRCGHTDTGSSPILFGSGELLMKALERSQHYSLIFQTLKDS